MIGLLQLLISLYILLIIVRALLSWFSPQRHGGAVAQVDRVVILATEPLLGPLRRVLPRPGGSSMPIDLSPMVAVLLLALLRALL